MSKKITIETKNNIQSYIQCDDDIKKQEKDLRELKKKREIYSNSIIDYIITNNYINSDIKVNNKSKIIYKETSVNESLNQPMIKRSICNFFNEQFINMTQIKRDKISNELYNYIINSRKSTKKLTLKRTIL